MNHWALVTGSSSGIGLATAELLAKNGHNLLLVARRKERLARAQSDLQKRFGIQVRVVELDVRHASAIDHALREHSGVLSEVDVLINNAGLAKGVEKLQAGKLEDWDAMIDTNIKGLLYMTRAVLPHMLARGSGHIVNLGSVAGRWAYPGGAVYCASKFAVRALSEGLRMDLLGTPLRVTNIEPGMVETEFSEVRLENVEKAKSVYKGMKPLSATDIAETILWCVQRPPHVNIQELVIFPTDQAAIQLVHRST
jgi:3-hydroxy acid dehydrogenase/malonic semialdehyde reductase